MGKVCGVPKVVKGPGLPKMSGAVKAVKKLPMRLNRTQSGKNGVVDGFSVPAVSAGSPAVVRRISQRPFREVMPQKIERASAAALSRIITPATELVPLIFLQRGNTGSNRAVSVSGLADKIEAVSGQRGQPGAPGIELRGAGTPEMCGGVRMRTYPFATRQRRRPSGLHHKINGQCRSRGSFRAPDMISSSNGK